MRVVWFVGGAVLFLGSSIGLWLMREFPAWAWMWMLALVVYAAFKWASFAPVVAASSKRTRGAIAFSPSRLAGYFFLWPGMDAIAFLSSERFARPPRRTEWLAAALNILASAVLLAGLAIGIEPITSATETYRFATAWLTMAAVVMALHFGTLNAISLMWRAARVDARPLMKAPLAARSLSDFWGGRWNLAFRDFAHTIVFRPLSRRVGTVWGMFGVFAFSGLVHDIVISTSSGAGYGRPTLYFLLQGAGVMFERSRIGKRIGLGRGWRGWLFAALALLAPSDLLFHAPFLNEVVLPMLEAIARCIPT